MVMDGQRFDLLPLEIVRERFADGPGIALIDIDSTVMDTGPRNLAILEEAAREAFPELRDAEGHMKEAVQGWNITSALARRLGLSPERRDELRKFWADRFFTGPWLEHDTPYPGAVSFLRLLAGLGAELVYFTGRDLPNMAEGTLESFRRHGVPHDEENGFIFKPDPAEEDLAFKERSLGELSGRGRVLLALENEPANANRIHRAFPRALTLFVETITTENPEPLDPGIVSFRRYP